MKIAIVTPVYPPYHGGIGAVAAAHYAVLRRRGHDVTVYTPRYSSMNNAEAPEGVRYLPALVQYGNAAFVPSLTKAIQGADIIHVHYPFFGGAEVINWHRNFLHKKGSKVIMHYHMDVKGVGIRALLFGAHHRLAMPSIMKHADAVIATSQNYAQHSFLSPLLPRLKNKLTIVPNGVDTQAFHPVTDRSVVKQKNGFSPEEKIVLFVGGLDPAHYFKGVEYLIEALARLREPSSLWRGVIVGEGALKQQYQDLAAQLGVDAHIAFTGRVENGDLPSYYQMADVTVLPSIDRSEAFGMVLIESLACGTPVIASDLPGVRSVVTPDVGLLVPPRDVSTLAGAVQKFLTDETFALQCGAQGRVATQQHYDWEIIGNQLEMLYMQLCQKK